MPKSRDWNTGFTDGYLACLFSFTGHHTGDSVEFREAVANFGDQQALLSRARRIDDIVLPELRKAIRANNERRATRSGRADAQKASER